MKAILVDTDTGIGAVLDPVIEDTSVYVDIPALDLQRQVLLGRTIEEYRVDTGPYSTWLIFKDSADWKAEQDRVLGPDANYAARLLHEIFGSVALEPQLNYEVVGSEAGTVIVVDLKPHYPNYELHVPERLLP